MGISESSFDAWGEVRGKPSRMKDASGEDEGEAGAASAREVLDGTHDLAFSSERMRRRIMSSGTREPDCMWESASWPAVRMPFVRGAQGNTRRNSPAGGYNVR